MRVAFIGLGTMGAHMATNVMKAGHQLTVYNRTHAKEEPLAALGADRAATPAQAAVGAEVVVTMVALTEDVLEVVLGAEGVIQGIEPGAVVVDMSTISPQATRQMAQALAAKGAGLVDAPVSGGPEGARLASLAIMIGGEDAHVQKAWPVLEAMGGNLVHVGPSGSGQLTKAINQTVLAGTYLGVAEGMVLGLKAGLDMDKVLAAIGGGAARSWVLENRAGNMLKDEYPLGFRVLHHRKDLRIALDAAREAGAALPVAALVEQLENALIARGMGDEDVSVVARALREIAGL